MEVGEQLAGVGSLLLPGAKIKSSGLVISTLTQAISGALDLGFEHTGTTTQFFILHCLLEALQIPELHCNDNMRAAYAWGLSNTHKTQITEPRDIQGQE